MCLHGKGPHVSEVQLEARVRLLPVIALNDDGMLGQLQQVYLLNLVAVALAMATRLMIEYERVNAPSERPQRQCSLMSLRGTEAKPSSRICLYNPSDSSCSMDPVSAIMRSGECLGKTSRNAQRYFAGRAGAEDLTSFERHRCS